MKVQMFAPCAIVFFRIFMGLVLIVLPIMYVCIYMTNRDTVQTTMSFGVLLLNLFALQVMMLNVYKGLTMFWNEYRPRLTGIALLFSCILTTLSYREGIPETPKLLSFIFQVHLIAPIVIGAIESVFHFIYVGVVYYIEIEIQSK